MAEWKASTTPQTPVLPAPQPRLSRGAHRVVAFPAAPWHARGVCWVGLFRTPAVTQLPGGLRPLTGGRWRAIALIRYEDGSSLRYDELIVATPARAGVWPGIHIEHIFVNSEASLWGGRRIWGLPKQLAEFAWREDGCTISDERGVVVDLRLARLTRGVASPPIPLVAPSFGLLDGRPAYMTAPLVARIAPGGMRVAQWSPRLGSAPTRRPLLSVAGHPFHVRFTAPWVLRRQDC